MNKRIKNVAIVSLSSGLLGEEQLYRFYAIKR